MLYFLECGMSDSRFGDMSVYQILLLRNSRDYRYAWRVNAGQGDARPGAPEHRELVMAPSDRNAHVNNGPRAPGKLAADLHRRPGFRDRIAHLLEVARSVRRR